MQSVKVSVFFSKPMRMDIYVENKLVAPTNADWKQDGSGYELKKPFYPGTEA